MFKSKFSIEKRQNESRSIRIKYPDRVPIICEKALNSTDTIPLIDKTKYLVPSDLTFGQMIFVIISICILAKHIVIYIV